MQAQDYKSQPAMTDNELAVVVSTSLNELVRRYVEVADDGVGGYVGDSIAQAAAAWNAAREALTVS